MADAPKFDGVKVVVKRTGFYGNALRPIGSSFKFTGNKLPSWVVLADDPEATKTEKAKPLNGDTKPKDAQAAVKAKASAASGDSQG